MKPFKYALRGRITRLRALLFLQTFSSGFRNPGISRRCHALRWRLADPVEQALARGAR